MIRAAVAGVGLTASCAAIARLPNLVDSVIWFLVLFCVAWLCYAAAVWSLRGEDGLRPAALVLVAGLVARAILLPALPTLSTDAYRYVWDARVAHAGISPYAYAPAELRAHHLARRRNLPAAEPPDLANDLPADRAALLPGGVPCERRQRAGDEGGDRARGARGARRGLWTAGGCRIAARPSGDLCVESARARRGVGHRARRRGSDTLRGGGDVGARSGPARRGRRAPRGRRARQALSGGSARSGSRPRVAGSAGELRPGDARRLPAGPGERDRRARIATAVPERRALQPRPWSAR